VLSYVGLIHGAQLGWGVSPLVSLGYLMFAVTCAILMRGQPAVMREQPAAAAEA
jgi:hypothetical protein